MTYTVSIISFLLFTGLVAFGTWFFTRKTEHSSNDGFFLAGRSLTFPVIAGSLLLTNLSTEQMVGLNGAAFAYGFSVMAWEVVAVVALVLMALFFLPKFLRAGITTVPQYLAQRFDHTTELICNIIFLAAYALILLPIILYTGARGMLDILDVQGMLGLESEMTALVILVIAVAIIGSLYAIWGGLSSCAISDSLNGIGLLVGGLLITFFAFSALGSGSFSEGFTIFKETATEQNRLNSIGAPGTNAPFFTLFSGIFLINTFYWCTNQQIIQRTLGAKSLAEGQKGVLLTGLLKLFGPIYLVLPGIIAAVMITNGMLDIAPGADGKIVSDKAYGALVNFVLPAPLKGFFAAVLLGAILSSFNSALNSTCTLYSLGIYKRFISRDAGDHKVVSVGRYFGVVITIFSIIVAPLLGSTGGIFNYLQKMNALYFIPILAVVIMGMMTKFVPAIAAKSALVAGIVIIGFGYFVPPFNKVTDYMSEFHFVAIVFVFLLVMMYLITLAYPRETPYEAIDAKATDLTPWKYAKYAGIVLVIIVGIIYASFANFSSVNENNVPYPAVPGSAEISNTTTATITPPTE